MRSSLVAASLASVASVSAATLAFRAGPLDGLSPSCQSTFSSAVSTPAGTCLNLSGLPAIAAVGSDVSLIDPLNTYLAGLCAAAPCASTDFSSLSSSIVSGCPDDLTKFGITTQAVNGVFSELGMYYTPGRSITCSQDTSNNNAFCVTSTLQALEKALGAPLSITSFTGANFYNTVAQKGATTEVICTPCVQSAWVTVKGILPSQDIINAAQNFLSNLCGANFVSGSAPAQIVTVPGAASA